MTEPFNLFFQMRLAAPEFDKHLAVVIRAMEQCLVDLISSRSRSAMKAGFVMLFSMTLSVVEDNPTAVQRKCRR